jgi:hypothetical protein
MFCPDRQRLFEKWCDASRRYQDAVLAARGRTGVDFDQARLEAEREKAACAVAESALHEHEQQHGCSGSSQLKHSA